MENESALKVLEYKLNDYAFGYEDFKVPFELMVNITLSEYRALVKSDAVARAEIERLKAEVEKFKSTADKLNKENVLLKGQLQAITKDELAIKNKVLDEVRENVIRDNEIFKVEHNETEDVVTVKDFLFTLKKMKEGYQIEQVIGN